MFDSALLSSPWLLTHLSTFLPASPSDFSTALPFAALFSSRPIRQSDSLRSVPDSGEASLPLPRQADTGRSVHPVVTIAVDQPDQDAARRLVEERYAWRGYDVGSLRSPSNTRREVTLLARSGSRAVGTMTMGFDHDASLFVDHAYPEAMSEVRAKGRTVCELTRLAVSERADTRATFSAMFNLAYFIGRRMLGVTDALVEVNPRHVSFYKRAFGFLVESEERICERVKAPAVLLRLSMQTLEERMQMVGASLPGAIEFAAEAA